MTHDEKLSRLQKVVEGRRIQWVTGPHLPGDKIKLHGFFTPADLLALAEAVDPDVVAKANGTYVPPPPKSNYVPGQLAKETTDA